MNRKALTLTLAGLLAAGAGTAMACEYKAGETMYKDYAYCRYGEDTIVVVDLPEGSGWESCVYHVEPFRPEKLLAITKTSAGKELLSLNDRTQIGNPCYLTKKRCDTALKAYNQGSN